MACSGGRVYCILQTLHFPGFLPCCKPHGFFFTCYGTASVPCPQKKTPAIPHSPSAHRRCTPSRPTRRDPLHPPLNLTRIAILTTHTPPVRALENGTARPGCAVPPPPPPSRYISLASALTPQGGKSQLIKENKTKKFLTKLLKDRHPHERNEENRNRTLEQRESYTPPLLRPLHQTGTRPRAFFWGLLPFFLLVCVCIFSRSALRRPSRPGPFLPPIPTLFPFRLGALACLLITSTHPPLPPIPPPSPQPHTNFHNFRTGGET